MKEILKRYSLAMFFLFLVVALMVLGTMGVKMFGDKMFEGTDIKMEPRGERLTK